MTSCFLRLIPLVALGCATPQNKAEVDSALGDEGAQQDTAAPSGDGAPDEDDTESTDGDTEEDRVEEDDASIVAVDMPTAVRCGETVSVSVSVQNAGLATWTREEGYKLGAVDDSDPFYLGDPRVWLPADASVAPGDTWTFEFELSAPESPGFYLTDWQMVHEAVQWFGESTSREIDVVCADSGSDPDSDPDPDVYVPPDPPVLSEVSWLHSDVSSWPVTGTLSSVSVSSDQICLDYDKAHEWPIHDMEGVEVVANPWIFIWHEEQWYAATWEWLRPGQTCKALSAVAGSHIKQPPFGASSGWVPTSGERYWFMVSGLARSSSRTVIERTNLVEVIWP